MISYTSGLFLLDTVLVGYLLGWSNSPFLYVICDSYVTPSSFLLWKANFPSRGKKVFLGWNVCPIRLDERSEVSLYWKVPLLACLLQPLMLVPLDWWVVVVRTLIAGEYPLSEIGWEWSVWKLWMRTMSSTERLWWFCCNFVGVLHILVEIYLTHSPIVLAQNLHLSNKKISGLSASHASCATQARQAHAPAGTYERD